MGKVRVVLIISVYGERYNSGYLVACLWLDASCFKKVLVTELLMEGLARDVAIQKFFAGLFA